MKTLTLAVYAVSGVLALLAGVLGLVAPGLALPPDLTSPLTVHLIREEAAAFVFIGMMLLWCFRHFERRRPIHIGLVVFTGLFAVIHWLGYLQDGRISTSAVVNTIPFVIFVLTMPRGRVAVERQAQAG